MLRPVVSNIVHCRLDTVLILFARLSNSCEHTHEVRKGGRHEDPVEVLFVDEKTHEDRVDCGRIHIHEERGNDKRENEDQNQGEEA